MKKAYKTSAICIFCVVFCAAMVVLGFNFEEVFAKNNKDVVPPVITVDFQGYSISDLPVGQVGVKFNVFNATAFDAVSGECKVDVSVSLTGTNRNIYDIGKNCFTPTEAGTYVLCYKTTDSAGNAGVKKYSISVKEEVLSPQIICTPEESYNVYTGEVFDLIDAYVTGGSGMVKTECKVFYGEDEKASFDLFDESFLPKKSGEYTIKYLAKDYLGRTDEKSYSLIVSNSEKPIISTTPYPEYVTSGTVLSFADFTAYDYSGDGAEKEAERSVLITYGGNSRTLAVDETFTVEPLGAVGEITPMTVELKAQGLNGVENKEFAIKVVNVKSGDRYYLPSYFVKSEGITNSTSEAATFLTASEGSSLATVKSIIADGYRFGFTLSGMESVKITFTDESKAEQAVTMQINDVGGKTAIIYSDEVNTVSNAFGNEFIIGYQESTKALYFNQGGGNAMAKIAQINRYDNGKAFEGFSSGKIRMRLEFGGVTESGKISVTQLGNVVVESSDYIEDMSAPQMHIDEFPVVRINFGETFYVPKAIAADILSEVRSFNVTVFAPDGNKVITNGDPKEGYTIKGEQYGIYRIIYVAVDEKNNKPTSGQFAVTVIDRVKPVITVNGTIPTTGTVGKKIILPDYSVTDNLSDESYLVSFILVVTPQLTYRIIDEQRTFIPTVAGKHTIRYYVEDEDGNYTITESVLLVKGGSENA